MMYNSRERQKLKKNATSCKSFLRRRILFVLLHPYTHARARTRSCIRRLRCEMFTGGYPIFWHATRINCTVPSAVFLPRCSLIVIVWIRPFTLVPLYSSSVSPSFPLPHVRRKRGPGVFPLNPRTHAFEPTPPLLTDPLHTVPEQHVHARVFRRAPLISISRRRPAAQIGRASIRAGPVHAIDTLRPGRERTPKNVFSSARNVAVLNIFMSHDR